MSLLSHAPKTSGSSRQSPARLVCLRPCSQMFPARAKRSTAALSPIRKSAGALSRKIYRRQPGSRGSDGDRCAKIMWSRHRYCHYGRCGAGAGRRWQSRWSGLRRLRDESRTATSDPIAARRHRQVKKSRAHDGGGFDAPRELTRRVVTIDRAAFWICQFSCTARGGYLVLLRSDVNGNPSCCARVFVAPPRRNGALRQSLVAKKSIAGSPPPNRLHILKLRPCVVLRTAVTSFAHGADCSAKLNITPGLVV